MAVFMDGSLRGAPAATARESLLDAFAELGAIEYATSTRTKRRRSTQYLVRVADPYAPWHCMDGKELFPWLLGIAEAAAAFGRNKERARALLVLLDPYGKGADPVPAEDLAGALNAAGKSAAASEAAARARAGVGIYAPPEESGERTG